MEFRQLRYFIAVGEEQNIHHAAEHLRVAQPALSRQIQNLEEEIGFKLFERLPRGVRLTPAGHIYLNEARRLLGEVNGSVRQARRVAHGELGTLRVGFVESASWHGIVPNSFRVFLEKQPEVELDLRSLSSFEQIPAVEAGSLDAGYAVVTTKLPKGIEQVRVKVVNVVLAVPAGHPLTHVPKLRLRDLVNHRFVWFPRRSSPAMYDRLMAECEKGGLREPQIVQETRESTLLSLVACGLGVGFISGDSHWRCPPAVVLLPVSDLNFQISFDLIYRQDNRSALLAKFVSTTKALLR
jgi:DNA-binding transcriptional LysR family regulator